MMLPTPRDAERPEVLAAPLLDARQLMLIDLLATTGSVTRAAERLGQSQPTVSLWLARLRRALGDPLFVRTSAGMQPTPHASALLPAVREALAALQRLAQPRSPFDPASTQRPFRVAMTDASHVTLLPRLFAHVRAAAPRSSLAVTRIEPGIAQRLEAGEVDLALGLVPELEAGFYQQTLFDQDWVCLANARHPRVGAGFGLADYRREAHVGIPQGTGQPLLEAALKAQRVQRQVLLQMPGFLGLPAILSTTDLVATLPRQIGETLARASGLAVLPCPVRVPHFLVKQHWHARFHHDEGNRWLRGVCEALFARQRPRRR